MDTPVSRSVLLFCQRRRLHGRRERHDIAPAQARMYVRISNPPYLSQNDVSASRSRAFFVLFIKQDITSPQETRALYLALVTLLFSYAYDARTTQHDPTPESAWTISALTPAFSALDPPPYPSARGVGDPPPLPQSSLSSDVRELTESLIPSYRRALAFPLYRSWALAEACRADAARLLARGTRTVLRCLLELRAILDAHEVYYVYSRIWLDDFCRWIQTCARYGALRVGG